MVVKLLYTRIAIVAVDGSRRPVHLAGCAVLKLEEILIQYYHPVVVLQSQ